MDRLHFVATFVAAIGIPLIFAVVPSARRFFVRSRAAQTIAAFVALLAVGIALPVRISLAIMGVAWLMYLFAVRRRQTWAWALWLPPAGTSLLGTLLWLSAIASVSSPGRGSYEKLGATIVAYYVLVAPLVLLVSVFVWPREPERGRPQSLACGFGFWIGFLIAVARLVSKML